LKTIHFELLLGRKVRDSEGRKAGRILAATVEVQGEDCVVREYHLGAAALLTRLGFSAGLIAGLPVHSEPIRVPWEKMDLRDPRNPRLTCPLAELKGK
jgi:hypothetical protein